MKPSHQINPHFIRYVRAFGEQWLGVDRASRHVRACWHKWAYLQIAEGNEVFPDSHWANELEYDSITGAASPTLL